MGASIRERYGKLWHEINRKLQIGTHQKYKIEERVRKLNALGFSVEQVLMESEKAHQLLFQVRVADRHYHRNKLERLIGLEAEEQQAQVILNEIQHLRTDLSRKEKRSVPLTTAAEHWYQTCFTPLVNTLQQREQEDTTYAPVEVYCLMLEHKWYLSEKARRDVGHVFALEDYLQSVL